MVGYEQIHRLLQRNGVHQIIETVDLNNYLDPNQLCDARSAAFSAMGIAVRTCETCALIVPGEYITNILTAVTEAWFQKCNLLVVGVFHNLKDFQTAWMDRYLVSRLEVRIENLEEEMVNIGTLLKECGPKLLSILCYPEKEMQHDYGKILPQFLGNESRSKVICYNPLISQDLENRELITAIEKKYKYGVISKYIGSSLVKPAGILLCTPECLFVDINVFRTRYQSKWMKIVIHDQDGVIKKRKIDNWIMSNGWEYTENENLTYSTINEFIHTKKAAVLVVR